MLINSLPSILPHLHDEVSAGRCALHRQSIDWSSLISCLTFRFAPYLREDADISEVKRAYFRAIRFLHPDKLPGRVRVVIIFILSDFSYFF